MAPLIGLSGAGVGYLSLGVWDIESVECPAVCFCFLGYVCMCVCVRGGYVDFTIQACVNALVPVHVCLCEHFKGCQCVFSYVAGCGGYRVGT